MMESRVFFGNVHLGGNAVVALVLQGKSSLGLFAKIIEIVVAGGGYRSRGHIGNIRFIAWNLVQIGTIVTDLVHVLVVVENNATFVTFWVHDTITQIIPRKMSILWIMTAANSNIGQVGDLLVLVLVFREGAGGNITIACTRKAATAAALTVIRRTTDSHSFDDHLLVLVLLLVARIIKCVYRDVLFVSWQKGRRRKTMIDFDLEEFVGCAVFCRVVGKTFAILQGPSYGKGVVHCWE